MSEVSKRNSVLQKKELPIITEEEHLIKHDTSINGETIKLNNIFSEFANPESLLLTKTQSEHKKISMMVVGSKNEFFQKLSKNMGSEIIDTNPEIIPNEKTKKKERVRQQVQSMIVESPLKKKKKKKRNSNSNMSQAKQIYLQKLKEEEDRIIERKLVEDSNFQETRELEAFDNVYDSMSESDEEVEKQKPITDELQEVTPFLFSIKSKFKKHWNRGIFCVMLLTVLVEPYLLSTGIKENGLNFFTIMNVCCEIVFFFDIIFNFFTPYYDENDNLIRNIKIISEDYLTSWFIPDILASMPLTLISVMYSVENIYTKYLKWTVVIRLFKLYNKKANINYFNITFIEDLELRRIVNFQILFMVLVHVLSCLFVFLGRSEFDIGQNWITKYAVNNSDSDVYIASLYYHFVTMYTIGYGDIYSQNVLERVYNIVVMFFGIAGYSYIITALSNYFGKMDTNAMKIQEVDKELEELDAKYDIPVKMFNSITLNIHKIIESQKIGRDEMLESLPKKLRIQLLQTIFENEIDNFEYFIDQPQYLCFYILQSLVPLSFDQNEIVFETGTVLDEFYFVKKGLLSINLGAKYSSIEVGEVTKNKYFGDVLMYLNHQSPYELKCKSTNIEILTFSREKFMATKKIYNENILSQLRKSVDALEILESNRRAVIELYKYETDCDKIKEYMAKINKYILKHYFEDIYEFDRRIDYVDKFFHYCEEEDIIKFLNLSEDQLIRKKEREKKLLLEKEKERAKNQNYLTKFAPLKTNNKMSDARKSRRRMNFFNSMADIQQRYLMEEKMYKGLVEKMINFVKQNSGFDDIKKFNRKELLQDILGIDVVTEFVEIDCNPIKLEIFEYSKKIELLKERNIMLTFKDIENIVERREVDTRPKSVRKTKSSKSLKLVKNEVNTTNTALHTENILGGLPKAIEASSIKTDLIIISRKNSNNAVKDAPKTKNESDISIFKEVNATLIKQECITNVPSIPLNSNREIFSKIKSLEDKFTKLNLYKKVISQVQKKSSEVSYCRNCSDVKKKCDLASCSICKQDFCFKCSVPCKKCNKIYNRNCLIKCNGGCGEEKCKNCDFMHDNCCLCKNKNVCKECTTNSSYNSSVHDIENLSRKHCPSECLYVKSSKDFVYLFEVPKRPFYFEATFAGENVYKGNATCELILYDNNSETYRKDITIDKEGKVTLKYDFKEVSIGGSQEKVKESNLSSFSLTFNYNKTNPFFNFLDLEESKFLNDVKDKLVKISSVAFHDAKVQN